MGFFGGEDDMDDASADMLEWDLKSDGLDTAAFPSFPERRSRSNTLGSAIFNMQEDEAPPAQVSRVILGTEEPPRTKNASPISNENHDFDFAYHGKEEEEEVVIEEEVIVVESEADVVAKKREEVVVEEQLPVVAAQVVEPNILLPPTTPPKDNEQQAPPSKRVRISATPWDDIRVYNYCWPQLKQEGWVAKPGGDGLSSSWTYLAPGVRKTSEGVLGTTVFKSERALIKHCAQQRADLIAEAEDFIFSEEESARAQKQAAVQKQAPPPQQPVQTPKKPKTAKPPPAPVVVVVEKKPRVQFSEIWPKLLEEGWTVRAGTGLESWRYVFPNSPGKKRGVDYLCSEEQVVEHILATTTVIKPQEKPPLNFESELWPHLQNNKGWRYTTGTGVIEYVFYLPNGKSKRNGGKLGVDFLHSQAEVEEYCRLHPEQLEELKN